MGTLKSGKWIWKSLSPVWLCDLMDCIVHGILQARILEWVAFPFSRGSSQPRDGTQASRTAGGFFTSWAPREAHWELWLIKRAIFWCMLYIRLIQKLSQGSQETANKSEEEQFSFIRLFEILELVYGILGAWDLNHENRRLQFSCFTPRWITKKASHSQDSVWNCVYYSGMLSFVLWEYTASLASLPWFSVWQLVPVFGTC